MDPKAILIRLNVARTGMEWWGYNGSSTVGDSDYYYPTIPLTWGYTYNNTCISVGGNGYIDVTPAGCYAVFQQKSSLKRYSTTWTFISDYMFEENI